MISAREALERLREGNRRFVSGVQNRDRLASQTRRSELVGGQEPFAVILGCSDSRVPVEIVFDQDLGDLFVIRVAGNIVASSQIGSVEFAAERFGTRLVVVLGHSQCGAVRATVEELRRPTKSQSPNLGSIVYRIRPAVEELLGDGAPARSGGSDAAGRTGQRPRLGESSTAWVGNSRRVDPARRVARRRGPVLSRYRGRRVLRGRARRRVRTGGRGRNSISNPDPTGAPLPSACNPSTAPAAAKLRRNRQAVHSRLLGSSGSRSSIAVLISVTTVVIARIASSVSGGACRVAMPGSDDGEERCREERAPTRRAPGSGAARGGRRRYPG